MTKPPTPRLANKNNLDQYLSAETTAARIRLLCEWRDSGIAIDDWVVKGMMTLPLAPSEIIAALDISDTMDKAGFELWVMDNLLSWDQNIAATALRAWARITDRVLWHRLLPIAGIPGLPQRIRYTILDVAVSSHGYEVTNAILKMPDWEELSSAFHALLMERAIQFDLPSTRLTKTAWKILNDIRQEPHPDNKSMIPAMAWLCRHSEKDLQKWISEAPESLWKDTFKSTLDAHSARASAFTKIEKSIAKSPDDSDFIAKLPVVWSRSETPATICQNILKDGKANRTTLYGVSQETILKATEQSPYHAAWTEPLIARLPMPHAAKFSTNSSTPFAASYQSARFQTLAEARSLACGGGLGIATDLVRERRDFSATPDDAKSSTAHPIQSFFSAVSGGAAPVPADGSVWSALADAWNGPAKADLNQLSTVARKSPGIAVMAKIAVLARMTGRDDAVLKLLDRIRGSDESEIRAVARALAKINTPRSLLELIAMLTRPNTTLPVQQEIVSLLAGKDLKGLQNELRGAVQDLRAPIDKEDPLHQLKDDLSSMLLPVSAAESNAGSEGSRSTLASIASVAANTDLDKELGGMIPHFSELSSEVKRALRTALFFNKTVATSHHKNSIDLSPVIDMQYKAMELLYREFFEAAVSKSLQNGAIQRKLDVIGYARPIMHQMDNFENYIAALPIVKDIPFFSKFKLRKMLRALCQFEPGRRFTLDGLKAFGLYFLVFGRQNCKHGLANTFNVGARDDLDLAEFCKELHIFQDFRNRAAHEGFHPEASNDIAGIWRTTASVVQWAFKIRDAQRMNSGSNQTQRAS